LTLNLALIRHLGSLSVIFRIVRGISLSRRPILTRDVVADQLDQLGLGELLSECRRLHYWIGATIRRTRTGGELGVPFDVTQRAPFFCFFEVRSVQRELHELLFELCNEVERNAAAIVVDAVFTAKQALVGHG
jgi:hypothetical protein